jgi:hypothetical protein
MLTAELVKLGPDVIIALGTAETIAAKTSDHDDPYRNLHCRSVRHALGLSIPEKLLIVADEVIE